MDRAQRRWSPARAAVIAAIAVGVAAGSYGVASAATGSSSAAQSSAAQQSNRQPWVLTGDTAAKVRELALAKVPGGTVVRVETDADGNAAYEAHMVKADGTPVTVYVSKQLEVVSVQTGMPRPPQGGFSPTGSSA
jgi:uncharacterized membrane protein YkoI